MIIVEGKNDLIFLKWLLDRFTIVYEEILLRHIGGKTNIENVLKSCAAGSDYSENGITIKFSDYEIEQLLIVKDFDIK